MSDPAQSVEPASQTVTHDVNTDRMTFLRVSKGQEHVLVVAQSDYQVHDVVRLFEINEYGRRTSRLVERDEHGRFLNQWVDNDPVSVRITHVLTPERSAGLKVGFYALSVELAAVTE